MSGAISPDPAQIEAYLRHGKNIRAAAVELGMNYSTLRARLIAWKELVPAVKRCKACGKLIRLTNSRDKTREFCKVCQSRENARLAEIRRINELVNDIEYAPLPPERNPFCSGYNECLSAAADKDEVFSCEGCTMYSEIEPNIACYQGDEK